jgi:glycerophosphoryl diester phosphodiesterase
MRRDRPEIVGHGGAGDFYPGNSRPSIETALAIGVDRVECDVQRSADGALVLVHDEHVRVGGTTIPVRAMCVEQLREALPDLLLLDECIAMTADRVGLLVDVKAPGYEREIAAVLDRYDAVDRTIVSSTHALALRRMRRCLPKLEVGLSTGHLATGISLQPARWAVTRLLGRAIPLPALVAARSVGATHLMVHHRVCTRRLVERAHAAGIAVYPWTADTRLALDRLLDLGVDGIITNRPDLLHEQLAERRHSLG